MNGGWREMATAGVSEACRAWSCTEENGWRAEGLARTGEFEGGVDRGTEWAAGHQWCWWGIGRAVRGEGYDHGEKKNDLILHLIFFGYLIKSPDHPLRYLSM